MAGQTLSVIQMYALARKAGLSAGHAVVAAAVGMAESSGRTAVTSSNPDGGENVGVWQLDTKGVGSGYTVAQLQDPSTNAKVMAKGSNNGQYWGPWATYASGAYASYLPQASAAEVTEVASNLGSSGWIDSILKDAGVAWNDTGGKVISAAGNAVGNLLSLPSQVTDFLSALEEPVKAAMWLFQPGNWARIIAGVFGFFLLIAGLVTLGMSA